MRDLDRLVTFRLAGQVSSVVVGDTISKIQDCISQNPTVIILGKGSNTLINPRPDIPPILQISPQLIPPQIDGNRMIVSSGMTVNKVLALSIASGLSGLEFSAGVPASIGGMIAMNFGCWGQQISDCLVRVWVMDLTTGIMGWKDREMLKFGYRSSCFQHQNALLLGAEFALTPANPDRIRSTLYETVQKRLAKQPLRQPTFGSIFKNPPGQFAGQLIAAAGLKGARVGDAQISIKHANFMINVGKATYTDAIELIKRVRNQVRDHSGIDLELEVRLA